MAMLMSRIESEASWMGLPVDALLLLAWMCNGRSHTVYSRLLALVTDAVHDAQAIYPQSHDHHGSSRRSRDSPRCTVMSAGYARC
uniref:U296i n=1 Tax=Mycobacterium leprae TaxID=1769 RepID=Q50148_MYCLR|nr:u296i [Mycobacterium leprae]